MWMLGVDRHVCVGPARSHGQVGRVEVMGMRARRSSPPSSTAPKPWAKARAGHGCISLLGTDIPVVLPGGWTGFGSSVPVGWASKPPPLFGSWRPPSPASTIAGLNDSPRQQTESPRPAERILAVLGPRSRSQLELGRGGGRRGEVDGAAVFGRVHVCPLLL